jgi:arylsulfatase A-like enzyme
MLLIFAFLLGFVAASPPSVVFVLLDDVGWADFGYNTPNPVIPTPNIDALSKQGVRLTNHYAQSTCSPSRAALLTGKYAINTGITFPLISTTPAGLNPYHATIPQKLREQGYQAHMVGKWHLGSATWTSHPVGRGFQSYTGSLITDADNYSKRLWGPVRPRTAPLPPLPPLFMGNDWMHAAENRSFTHYVEPRHPTVALTDEAINIMKNHKKNHRDEPLFLYVAFTAAHSPLQALPEHTAPCVNITHSWRRQFCGMMVGVDEAIRNISNAIRPNLGNNSILIVTSDNGGSTWFGGSNVPLRSGKNTPFEGGVKVPGFVVDYTPQDIYLGAKGRSYNGLMHISDWFPTLYSIAGGNPASIPGLDGKDHSAAIRDGSASPRTEVLLEMYVPAEFAFQDEDMISYRSGKYKLISGDLRDPNFYFESTVDSMNSTDTSPVRPQYEAQIRQLEAAFGQAPFDSSRVLLTHAVAMRQYVAAFRDATLLFDVEADPTERSPLPLLPVGNPVADANRLIVAQLRAKANVYLNNRPIQQPYYKKVSDLMWAGSLVNGDCTGQPASPFPACVVQQPATPPNCVNVPCKFVHPFLPDFTDPNTVPTEFITNPL